MPIKNESNRTEITLGPGGVVVVGPNGILQIIYEDGKDKVEARNCDFIEIGEFATPEHRAFVDAQWMTRTETGALPLHFGYVAMPTSISDIILSGVGRDQPTVPTVEDLKDIEYSAETYNEGHNDGYGDACCDISERISTELGPITTKRAVLKLLDRVLSDWIDRNE